MILSHFLVAQWTWGKRSESSDHDFILIQWSTLFLLSLSSDRALILIWLSNINLYDPSACFHKSNERSWLLNNPLHIFPQLHNFVSASLNCASSMHCLYPITRLSLLSFPLGLSKGLNATCFWFCVWMFYALTYALLS